MSSSFRRWKATLRCAPSSAPAAAAPSTPRASARRSLSTWENAAIERLLSRQPLMRFTEKTRDTLPRLLSDIETIRSRGWSIDDEEHTLGMRCLAAPIFNEYGEAIAGISISGPAVRLPDGTLAALGPVVKAAADGVTQAMGGRREDSQKHSA